MHIISLFSRTCCWDLEGMKNVSFEMTNEIKSIIIDKLFGHLLLCVCIQNIETFALNLFKLKVKTHHNGWKRQMHNQWNPS